MIEITVGCDPEVFLTKAGTLIPSCGLVGGTKESPKQITDKTWIQEDNVLVEFNMKPVKYDAPNCLRKAALESLKDVNEYLKSLDGTYNTIIRNFGTFGQNLWEVEAAWKFGCDPDLDAYSFGMENLPFEMANTTRYAGGHIHFGYDTDKTEIPKWALVQLCDYAMTTLKCDPIGGYRRATYGKAGAYRDKPYGFEYRSPSCEWLGDENAGVPELLCKTVHWALNNPKKARELFDAVHALDKHFFSPFGGNTLDRDVMTSMIYYDPYSKATNHIRKLFNETVKF